MPVSLPSLEVRGYSFWLSIPVVLLLIALPTAGLFWLTGEFVAPAWMMLFFGVLMALAIFGAGFKLRIWFDRPAGVINVERRFWFGARRHWQIPLADLRCWYYVKDSQSLVFRLRDGSRLGFVLVMDGDHRRAVEWMTLSFKSHMDVPAGRAESKRVKRAFMFGTPTVVLLISAVIVLVCLQIYGWPG